LFRIGASTLLDDIEQLLGQYIVDRASAGYSVWAPK